MKTVLIVLSFFLSLCCYGTELKPWYPRYLEIQPQAECVYRHYPTIRTGDGTYHHSTDDEFLHLSLLGAYDKYCVEIESTFAATRHRTFGFCDVRLTGRYQILDDVVGDPLSLVLGATIIQSCKIAVHDISCFYHGDIAAEFTLAAGKEVICEQFWTSRAWAVAGMGCADVGSPWIRGDLGWEHNFYDSHQLELWLHSIWGLGGNNLHPYHFRGYGPIEHGSIDLGIEYRYVFECGPVLGLGYSYRVYAWNFPSYANTLNISFLYPFGL